MSVEIATEAIVLGGVDYGEADRVVTLLSRDRGRLSAFAAGARKSRRRFAGALEPFTLLSVRLRERRGGDLHFLASASIVDAHHAIRDDLGRIAHAGHAAELCRELTREREPHEELFEALRAYLARLSASPAVPEDLLAFELAALGLVGLAPRLSSCAICGDAVTGGALFDPPHGGVLCAACEAEAFRGAVRIGDAVRGALEALQAAGPFGGTRIVDLATRGEVRQVVRRFTHHALGKEPRSVAVLAQLGLE